MLTYFFYFLSVSYFCALFPAADSSAASILQKQLFNACKNNEFERAYGIIRTGADPNITGPKGFNAAHIAVIHKAEQTLKMLCKKSTIDINAYSETGETPLSLAIRIHQDDGPALVEILLKNDADPNKTATKVEWTPLMIASRFNSVEIIKTLLIHHACPYRHTRKHNALSLAFLHNQPDAATLLLKQPGILTKYHPMQYLFAPHGTFKHDDNRDLMPMLKLLQSHGFNLNVPIKLGDNTEPIIAHILEQPGNFNVLEDLLACGITPPDESITFLYNSSLHTINHDRLKKLTLCLSSSRNIYTSQGRSFLIEAARLKKHDVALEIAKACPHYHNTTDEDRNNTLHHLVRTGEPNQDTMACIDILSHLTNSTNTNDATPLMLTQHPSVAARLILSGADIHARDNKGMELFMYHITFMRPEITSLLIYMGALQPAGESQTSGTLREKALQTAQHVKEALDHLGYMPEQVLTPSLRLFLQNFSNGPEKIHKIIRMLKHPERALKDPVNAQLLKQQLHLCSDCLQKRESVPRSFSALRR